MDHCREIKALLKANTGAVRLSTVFDDFVELTALALRNVVDRTDREAWHLREKQYLDIARRYDRAQLDRFGNALGHVVLAMRERPTDVLGRLYMELGIGNDHLGQFFTPFDVARLIAELCFGSVIAQVRERGLATLYEPACGAAAFVIATAELMRHHGLDPQQQLLVDAEDISPQAVHMAYIHLSALGVPAVVHRRDTLTQETFDSWPTGALLRRTSTGPRL